LLTLRREYNLKDIIEESKDLSEKINTFFKSLENELKSPLKDFYDIFTVDNLIKELEKDKQN